MPQPSLPSLRPPWTPDAMRVLARYRFATARQLAAALDADLDLLTGTAVNAGAEGATFGDGLASLVRDRLLTTLRPTGTMLEPEPELAYALTRRGAQVFAAEQDTTVPCVPDRRKSSLTLAHELGITELGIALDRLDAAGVVELLHWETARESIAVSVGVVSREGFEQVPLVADAYVVLRRGHETSAFLIEVDRGTVATARMRKKYLGYLAWQRLDGPMSRFGVKALRILTICPTPARLERLRSAAREVTSGGGTGFLWFGLAPDVRADDPATLLGPIWRIVREEPASQPLFRDDPVAPESRLDELGAIDDADTALLESRLKGVVDLGAERADHFEAPARSAPTDPGAADLPAAA